MFSFIDYAHEVYTISEAKHVDLGIAFSMLKTDIRGGHRYNTGDVELPETDFAKANAEFGKLSEAEELAVYEEWFDYMRRCYDALCKAYPDKEKLAVVAEAYRRKENKNGDTEA
jgi:Lon protease-like protein